MYHNHPKNAKTFRFFNNKKCCNDSNNSFTYVLYFRALARSYINNNGVAAGIGRFLSQL